MCKKRQDLVGQARSGIGRESAMGTKVEYVRSISDEILIQPTSEERVAF